ncbi:serine hydrolase domain-containing protein [Peribacillus sp. SCS-37]|uniref:serine hydrolase domain-containing protein n=1 Tax=Paraperibacillus esterisolvens TaxID=3115296 RepID=UPI0039059654
MNQGRKEELTAMISKELESAGIVGASVAIVEGSGVVYSKGFGFARLGEGHLMDPDTLMSIQSISKNFMATSIMQLVETGFIELDEPVVKHLPYFRTTEPEVSDQITIRQVLSHTAGFPETVGIANMIAPNAREIFSDTPTEFQEALDYYGLKEEELAAISDREDITRWFKKVELEGPPGSQWRYCTDAYVILADMFEKVTGMDWESHLEACVLRPLGMERTTSRGAEEAPNSAGYYMGQERTETPFPKNELAAPIGYLYSTANELGSYLGAHLNGGTVLLKPDSVKIMQNPHHPVSKEWRMGSEVRSYGLAWFTDVYKGQRIVEHGGGQMGVRSLMTLVPDLNLGIVVLMNTEGTVHHDICKAIINLYLNE